MSDRSPEVENVSVAIRNAFRSQKAQQTGRPYRPNARWDDDATWHRAAEACISSQADPTTWVQAVFINSRTPGGPFPNQLGGRAAAGWYAQLRDSVVDPDSCGPADLLNEEITMELNNAITLAVSVDDPLKVVLMARYHALPPYVRVVLLPLDEDILERWGMAAYAQISQNPGLCDRLQQRGYNLSWMDRFSR